MHKHHFPILNTHNRGKPLVYLDSAASAQKPQAVLDAMHQFYLQDYANIHRGIYELSERATQLYEGTREKVRQFIQAASKDEIVFVSGTTGAINLVAQAYAKKMLKANDEIIISTMEHHSNIVPWMMLKEEMGIVVKVIPIHDDGTLDMQAYENLFSTRTKLVAVTHASNVLGTINPIKKITAIAHAHQALVLVDGAQAAAHMPVDVVELGCDFYTFSAHKLYGPTGIGVLYIKSEWHDIMPPYQGGGDMIETVSFERVTFAKAPHKFEAGTPNIAGVIGLAAAIDYIQAIGMPAIFAHEQALLSDATAALCQIENLTILGTANPKLGVISFLLADIHAHDLATILDHEGIAVRAGHHCAMPLMARYDVPATVRASFGIYNEAADVAALIHAIHAAKRIFA